MAMVYSPPEGFDPPDTFSDEFKVNGHWDFTLVQQAEEKWIERLRFEARKQQDIGELVGEIIHFPVGDGYAQYMVWKHRPFQLIHLPLGDAWSIPEPYARGLRLADVRKQIESERRLNELFGRK